MDPENLEVDRNDDDSQESDATSLSSVSYKENEDPQLKHDADKAICIMPAYT